MRKGKFDVPKGRGKLHPRAAASRLGRRLLRLWTPRLTGPAIIERGGYVRPAPSMIINTSGPGRLPLQSSQQLPPSAAGRARISEMLRWIGGARC